MKNLITRFIREEEGQDLIEYALLLLLIAVGVAAVVRTIGGRVIAIFQQIATELGAA